MPPSAWGSCRHCSFEPHPAAPAHPLGLRVSFRESFLREGPAMKRFNLSAWAVAHPALVLFLILALAVGGALSFRGLGRSEDPNFTIKGAVVTAVWPGATAQEMQDQVADRIEKRLQELPWVDKVQTYTKPAFKIGRAPV